MQYMYFISNHLIGSSDFFLKLKGWLTLNVWLDKHDKPILHIMYSCSDKIVNKPFTHDREIVNFSFCHNVSTKFNIYTFVNIK